MLIADDGNVAKKKYKFSKILIESEWRFCLNGYIHQVPIWLVCNEFLVPTSTKRRDPTEGTKGEGSEVEICKNQQISQLWYELVEHPLSYDVQSINSKKFSWSYVSMP